MSGTAGIGVSAVKTVGGVAVSGVSAVGGAGWGATKYVGSTAAGVVGATTGAVVGAACKVPGVERVGELGKSLPMSKTLLKKWPIIFQH